MLSEITTIYDTEGKALVIDREVDHFFVGNFFKRKVIPLNNSLWIIDNGQMRPLASFIWEIWHTKRIPLYHCVVQKDPGRDFRLQNLELVRVEKPQKTA